MTYLLDSSVIIDFLKNKKYIVDFISSHKNDMFITSAICEAEILTGLYRLKNGDFSLLRDKVRDAFSSFYEVVPFESLQADKAGRIKAELLETGKIIEDMDILIAASAIVNEATLLTKNVKHFSRVPGLEIKELGLG